MLQRFADLFKPVAANEPHWRSRPSRISFQAGTHSEPGTHWIDTRRPIARPSLPIGAVSGTGRTARPSTRCSAPIAFASRPSPTPSSRHSSRPGRKPSAPSSPDVPPRAARISSDSGVKFSLCPVYGAAVGANATASHRCVRRSSRASLHVRKKSPRHTGACRRCLEYSPSRLRFRRAATRPTWRAPGPRACIPRRLAERGNGAGLANCAKRK